MPRNESVAYSVKSDAVDLDCPGSFVKTVDDVTHHCSDPSTYDDKTLPVSWLTLKIAKNVPDVNDETTAHMQ